MVELGQMLETGKLLQHFVPLVFALCEGGPAQKKHKLRLNDGASAATDFSPFRCGLITSGDVQALHGQHPVVVARVVEPVLHHSILGELLQDFDGFVLPSGFVEG